MDRNDVLAVSAVLELIVALRKESVDRNSLAYPDMIICTNVALRKESVDRNGFGAKLVHSFLVALRKESVDRNKYVVQCRKTLGGRSPQGERG